MILKYNQPIKQVCKRGVDCGSFNLLENTLPNLGITTAFVDIHDLDEVENAVRDNTKAIYIETLGNPNSDIPDIDALAELAHRHNIPLVADNTFGTPYLIRPIEHGADIVVHSATKFIGGHGTTLGGVIVDSGKFDWEKSGKFPAISDPNPSYHGVSFAKAAGSAAFVTYIRAILLRDTGATLSPFSAFLLLQGTETLSLRIERHVENAKKVIDFLKVHPLVEKVNHPSLPEHPDHELYKKYFPNGAGSIPVRVTSLLARKQRRYVVCELSFCMKIGLGTYMGLILSSCNFPYHSCDADFLFRDCLSP